MNPEYKSFPLLDCKSEENGTFSGYASTWKRDAMGDIIEPGAFARSIKAKNGVVPIFVDHSRSDWVGFSSELSEDDKGLRMRAALALEHSKAADAYALMKFAKTMNYQIGLSIGFIPTDVDADEEGRILKAIDLWEISLTPFPANRGSRVVGFKSVRNVEHILRDVAGCSPEQAKRTLSFLRPYLSADADGESPTPERDVTGLGQRYELLAAMRAYRPSGV